MITTIGLLIEAGKTNQEATPESLRAAAKVLEDKAKELEEPKLTVRQRNFIEGRYSDICDKAIIKSNDGSRGWFVGYGFVTEASIKESIKDAQEGWSLSDCEKKSFTIETKFGNLPVLTDHFGRIVFDFNKL